MSFLQDFQSQLLGFLFLSISICSGKKPAKSQIVEAKHSSIPYGGLANDLAVEKSFFLMVSRAPRASSTIG
jgi:hypothetical protein